MQPAPAVAVIPDQWYTDYHTSNRYCMQSLTDYIAERLANGGEPLTNHSISKEANHGTS